MSEKLNSSVHGTTTKIVSLQDKNTKKKNTEDYNFILSQIDYKKNKVLVQKNGFQNSIIVRTKLIISSRIGYK